MATTTAAHGSLGVWKAIIKKAFPGNKRIKVGKPRIIVSSSGVPDIASKVGTLCWDAVNSNAYICTQAAGTWVKINQ